MVMKVSTVSLKEMKAGSLKTVLPRMEQKGLRVFTLSASAVTRGELRIEAAARLLSHSETRMLHANNVTINGFCINNNNSKDLKVMDGFDAQKVRDTNFIGFNIVGKIDNSYREVDGLPVPVGICKATIKDSVIGDNVAIENANIANYIIEDKVTIYNVGRMTTTPGTIFGNGIEMEIVNEAGGRAVTSFVGMNTSDAYIWMKYRGDEKLMERLKEITTLEIAKNIADRGRVGSEAVIVNTQAVVDANIGEAAQLADVIKVENTTILSSREEKTGLENGVIVKHSIIGYASEVIDGAVVNNTRVGDNTVVEYGVCLTDSVVGDNSTFANGEIRNSLVNGNHQFHHGDAFLIATYIGGLSNSAQGSVIGSNHNSRQPDGEIIAERGFWPGLNTSFKHNCKFAAYTLVSKGDYQKEMNVKLPFSWVMLDPKSPAGVSVMPAFWFMYNMYALARSDWKFATRDKRKVKRTNIVTDSLAPDTVEEMLAAIKTLNALVPEDGEYYLTDMIDGKKVMVLKRDRAIETYDAYLKLYAADGLRGKLMAMLQDGKVKSWDELLAKLKAPRAKHNWVNVGGQLITMADLNALFEDIKKKKIDSWEGIHERYSELWKKYHDKELWAHQNWVLEKVFGKNIGSVTKQDIIGYLNEAMRIQGIMEDDVLKSRAKDYTGARVMTMDSPKEIKAVLGALKDDKFVKQASAAHKKYEKETKATIKSLNQLGQ